MPPPPPNGGEQLTDASSMAATVRRLDQTLQAHIAELKKLYKTTARQAAKARIEVQTPAQREERRQRVTVYVRVVYLKVGEIDTIKENFEACVFLQGKWREPRLDGYPPELVDNIDWEKYWTPSLYAENLMGEMKSALWYTVVFDSEGRATVAENRRIKGTFQENMELKEFPFDTQDLTVMVASEHLEDEVALEEDTTEFSCINRQSFVDEQEWGLHSHVDVRKRTLTSEYDNIRRKPVIAASCKAKRRPGFFIWNILLVMLFICSLSFATFSVSISKPQNRLQLSFTLVLTTIAFKFVANQSLPKISYLTYLDKYILTSMGTLCTICVWHAIVPAILYGRLWSGDSNTNLTADALITRITGDASDVPPADLALASALDHYILLVLGIFYVLFHIAFFLGIYIQSLRRQSRYALKDEEHQERLIKLQKREATYNLPPISTGRVDPQF